MMHYQLLQRLWSLAELASALLDTVGALSAEARMERFLIARG
jgi:hypothetical protein